MMFPSECELEVERSANVRGSEKAAAGRASARPGGSDIAGLEGIKADVAGATAPSAVAGARAGAPSAVAGAADAGVAASSGAAGARAAGAADLARAAGAGMDSYSAAQLSPVSSKGSISRISASSCTTARRGSVLPLTYWLTWLLPSFDPRSAAMRIRSACLRPRPSMAWRRHEAKTSTVVGAVFTVFSPSATSTPIMKLNSKFNFARVYHESSILRSKEFNFHCTSRSPHPIGTPACGCTSTCGCMPTCTCTSDSISPPHVTNARDLDAVHGL